MPFRFSCDLAVQQSVMENNDSCVIERLNRLEKTLKDHQANVINRAKADVEKCLAVSESNHRLIFHQLSKDLVNIFTNQHHAMKVQLANVEERLINIKSVQIGLMEARMIVNNQETMMQVGDKINKLGNGILKEFSVIKRRMTLLQKAVGEVKKNEKEKSIKTVKKKQDIEKSTDNLRRGKKSKNRHQEVGVITDEDEIEFLGEISNEKNNSEFDNDFLALMRDANVALASSKTVQIESLENDNRGELHDFTIAPMMPAALNADLQEPERDVTVSVELDAAVDVKTEINCKVKIVVPDEGNAEQMVSDSDATKTIISDLAQKLITTPDISNISNPATPIESTPMIKVRKLPLMCPQVGSKIMSRKRRASSSYLEFADTSCKTPEEGENNRLLLSPKRRKLLEGFDIESSGLDSSGMSQTVNEKTLVKGEVVSISFSCGLCGEDSFTKKDLEDHITDHHKNQYFK